MSPVGIGRAREGPASESDRVLLALQTVFRKFGHVLSADYVRFDRRSDRRANFTIKLMSQRRILPSIRFQSKHVEFSSTYRLTCVLPVSS